MDTQGGVLPVVHPKVTMSPLRSLKPMAPSGQGLGVQKSAKKEVEKDLVPTPMTPTTLCQGLGRLCKEALQPM